MKKPIDASKKPLSISEEDINDLLSKAFSEAEDVDEDETMFDDKHLALHRKAVKKKSKD